MGQARQANSQDLSDLKRLKVALVYDRVNKFGGAERVLQYLHRLFPDAPIYTLVYSPIHATWARGIKIIPSFFQAIPFFRTRHELLAPVAPLAFETHDLGDYNLVISVTSADAKSVIVKPGTLHITYCLTPTRYLWHLSDYKNNWKMIIFPKFLFRFLRLIDYVAAQRSDYMIAISQEVQKRINLYYARPSIVVYPPIDNRFFTKDLVRADNRRYYLVVGRLIPYKKTDLVIKTFNRLGIPLKVVGTGSELSRLRRLAKGNIEFLDDTSDSELIELYRRAKAVIFPQEEDFGLVPVEAMACGTPVIAYKKGGALETVVAGKTGLFFVSQTIRSLSKAVTLFESLIFDPLVCREHAHKFSKKNFSHVFLDTVRQLYQTGNF